MLPTSSFWLSCHQSLNNIEGSFESSMMISTKSGVFLGFHGSMKVAASLICVITTSRKDA